MVVILYFFDETLVKNNKVLFRQGFCLGLNISEVISFNLLITG
jgi:hypothetical protein